MAANTDGAQTVIGKQSTFTVGAIAAICGTLYLGLNWIRASDLERLEAMGREIKPALARFETQAEKTTELVVEMKGANRRLDELKDAVDGTTNKVIDLARGLGALEGRVKALEERESRK